MVPGIRLDVFRLKPFLPGSEWMLWALIVVVLFPVFLICFYFLESYLIKDALSTEMVMLSKLFQLTVFVLVQNNVILYKNAANKIFSMWLSDEV